MNYICTETSSVLELEICKPPVTSIARWWEVEFLLKGADSVVACRGRTTSGANATSGCSSPRRVCR